MRSLLPSTEVGYVALIVMAMKMAFDTMDRKSHTLQSVAWALAAAAMAAYKTHGPIFEATRPPKPPQAEPPQVEPPHQEDWWTQAPSHDRRPQTARPPENKTVALVYYPSGTQSRGDHITIDMYTVEDSVEIVDEVVAEVQRATEPFRWERASFQVMVWHPMRHPMLIDRRAILFSLL